MSAPLSTSYRSASGNSRILPAMPSPDDVSTVLPVESCVHELRKAVGRGEPAGLQAAASPEGIVSAIGIIYLAGCSHRPLGLHLRGHCQPRLGETVIEAPEDEPLARRVLEGFRRNTSPQDAKRVLYACMSDSPLRAQLVLTFMRRGFDLKEPLYHHRAEPALVDVFELAYTVSNECEHARQFVRFHRLTSGVYYARFEPSANVIPLVMGHFSAVPHPRPTSQRRRLLGRQRDPTRTAPRYQGTLFGHDPQRGRPLLPYALEAVLRLRVHRRSNQPRPSTQVHAQTVLEKPKRDEPAHRP